LPDGDYEFAQAAKAQGFRPTQKTDRTCVLDIVTLAPYALPEGFSFISMADEWSWQQYNRVMHRGFNHEGRPNHNESYCDAQANAFQLYDYTGAGCFCSCA